MIEDITMKKIVKAAGFVTLGILLASVVSFSLFISCSGVDKTPY